MKRILLSSCLAFSLFIAAGPGPAQDVLANLAQRRAATERMATDFWNHPELGYQEVQTSRRMIRELQAAGFTVQSGVAGMPTAFVASWGSGGPVIGLLAEMDALPGRSQAIAPVEREIPGRTNNQACGHNLYAAGSVATAIAVKQWLERTGTHGTIRLYGTPAEEGGAGKVYMARAGLFNDVDAVLHWHPAMVNSADPVTNTAVMSGRFRFTGRGGHTASGVANTRSALSAVQVMNHIVDLMRANVRGSAQISYVITQGGEAPNVVPEQAEVYYYAREENAAELRRLWERIVRAAEGAALGTETAMHVELIHATYNLLPNEALARVMDANLRRRVSTIQWTPEEQAFARQIFATFTDPPFPWGSESSAPPFEEIHVPGSTDVGDVSWVAPTTGVVTATWVPSTDAHTWQAAAVGAMGIGFKGMHLASEVLAMTMVDLYRDPGLLRSAREEFVRRRGPNFTYQPLLGDRPPPLDYRARPTNAAD